MHQNNEMILSQTSHYCRSKLEKQSNTLEVTQNHRINLKKKKLSTTTILLIFFWNEIVISE